MSLHVTNIGIHTIDYPLPPCESCTEDLVSLSFGIGNKGSGVQWHIHGPGFSETSK